MSEFLLFIMLLNLSADALIFNKVTGINSLTSHYLKVKPSCTHIHTSLNTSRERKGDFGKSRQYMGNLLNYISGMR